MGLRRIVRRADRWDYLVVVVVLAVVGVYLRFMSAHRAPPEAAPPVETRSSEGMDKLWLEASLGKDDVRPLPDPDMLWREPEVEAPLIAAPEPPAQPEPAPPAQDFPTPSYAAQDTEPARKPHIAPMAESLMRDRSGSATTAAFLEFPKPPPKQELVPVRPTAAAAGSAPKPTPRRQFRPLAGN